MANAKPSLAEYRRSLAAAERALLKARNDMRLAVKREGRPTDGIFSKTKFVPRETTQRWISEARREARWEIIKAVQMARKATEEPASSAFGRLMAAVSCDETPTSMPVETPQVGKPTIAIIVDNTQVITNEPTSPAA